MSTGDPGMAGLAFSFPAGSSPTQGYNLMRYTSSDCPASLSDSQIAQVRKVIRSEMRFSYLGETGDGLRTSLISTFPGKLASRLDVDGDGVRDIGYWTPPASAGGTGTFSVRQSSTGTVLIRSFGKLGDAPALGDYDDDGKTDLALLRRRAVDTGVSSDNFASLTWCKSSSSHSCASPGLLVSTAKGSDPFVPSADFDGNPATSEAAWLTGNTVKWTRTNVTPAWTTITLATLMPNWDNVMFGLYDSDATTDVVTWDATVGGTGASEFRIWKSSSGWTWASSVPRSFPVALNPVPSGSTSAARFGGVPIWGGKNSSGKGILRAWDPGAWASHQNWAPFLATSYATCTSFTDNVGTVLAPVHGHLDFDGDGYSDLVFLSEGPSGTGFFVIRTSPAGCAGNLFLPRAALTARTLAQGVPDFDGDGFDEVLAVDPDTMVWTLWPSGTGYSVATTYQLGAVYSVPL